jgi:hypothetical protein
MLRLPVLSSLLCLAALAAPAAAIPGPADDVAQFAKEIKDRLATLKSSLKDLDAQFGTDIAAIQDDYLGGTADAPATHLAVFGLVTALDADVAAALQAYTGGVQTDASTHLQGLLAFPNAFAVGDGGLIDAALASGVKARVKSTVLNFKKVHKLAALMKLIDNYDLIFDRRGQALDPIVPSDAQGEEADAPAKMLRIDLLMGGSLKSILGDGTLCLAGTANIGGTDHVVVAVQRVGDTAVTLNADIDQATGRWGVQFDALPEGNYAIVVSLDTVSVSDSLAIQ